MEQNILESKFQKNIRDKVFLDTGNLSLDTQINK